MPGLYIHIPFCESICPYCDFSTWKASKKQHPRWLKLVISEMQNRIPASMKFDTLFFGGGTPSLLELDVFEILMNELREYLDLSEIREFTLEANPGSVESDRLKSYKDHGVSKISLGVQSFSNRHLKTLGRLHTGTQARRSVELVQEHEFLTSVDLMFGIPGQLQDDWALDVSRAVSLAVPHISLYGLTFEKNTLFHQQLEKGRLQQIPDEDYAWMYLSASRFFETIDLKRYEVSNFSRENRESLHNLNYWNHSIYFGLGPGAHSFDGKKRYFNSKKFADYERFVLKGCKLTDQNHETLTPENLYEESLWLSLRTVTGLDTEKLNRKFSKSPSKKCLDNWISKGMLQENSPGRFSLKDDGWVYLDSIAVDCLAQSNYI